MGRRDRERKERIRAGEEALIAPPDYTKQAAAGRFTWRPDFYYDPVLDKTWPTKEEAIAEVNGLIRKTGWEARIVREDFIEPNADDNFPPFTIVKIGTFCPHGVSKFVFSLSDNEDGTWYLSEVGESDNWCECGNYTLPKGWSVIE
jgi:hypothetical protein